MLRPDAPNYEGRAIALGDNFRRLVAGPPQFDVWQRQKLPNRLFLTTVRDIFFVMIAHAAPGC
jgi:hypothetical protein